jgi:hypothetical protein
MARFIQAIFVSVEPHEQLPEGCSMRFKAHGAVRPIARIRYESEDGVGGNWTVEALFSDGKRGPAQTAPVEDSSAGSSNLVFGGDHGLRLTSLETGVEVAEAFLLLSDASVAP